MIGVMAGNVCYSSYNEAATAFFQSIAPVQQTNQLVSYEYIWGQWLVITRDLSGLLITTAPAGLPNFPTCDTMAAFNNGMAFGSALASALVVASLFGIVSRSAQ